MSKSQKSKQIIGALLMLLCSFLMFWNADIGYALVAGILSTSLLIYALRKLIFYFTMARHMVGGGSVLITGIILLDFGVFTMNMASLPKFYVVLYLLALNALSSVVSFLRAVENRRNGGVKWRWDYAHSLINLVLAGLSVFFLRSTTMLVYLYSIQSIYLAFTQIIRTIRPSSVQLQSY
ncbi:MAG: hypothetical protein K6E16_00785 [Lachnospiraceae bacterium]|nr:hypothetical protein [Lachnospiraceae bacterium]